MHLKKYILGIVFIIIAESIVTATPVTGDGLLSNDGSSPALPGFGRIPFAPTSPDDGVYPVFKFVLDRKAGIPKGDKLKFGITGVAPGAASQIAAPRVRVKVSSAVIPGVSTPSAGGGSGTGGGSNQSVITGPAPIPEPRTQLALLCFCLGGRIHRRWA